MPIKHVVIDGPRDLIKTIGTGDRRCGELPLRHRASLLLSMVDTNRGKRVYVVVMHGAIDLQAESNRAFIRLAQALSV